LVESVDALLPSFWGMDVRLKVDLRKGVRMV